MTQEKFKLILSKDFEEILLRISSKSILAKFMLEGIDSAILAEKPVNYIGFSSEDQSRISYLGSDKAEKLDPSDYWNPKYRYAIKPGSFILKVFKDIPKTDVEKFSSLYKSQFKEKVEFSIVEGEDIRRLYDYHRYSALHGSLGASCMKYDSCSPFFDIYVDNPDKIKMLVIYDDEKRIKGRALLWETEEGHKIMDRIYTIHDEEYLHQFKEWGDSNEYYYKTHQNWFNTLNFEKNGEQVNLKLTCKLKDRKYPKYPYIDTFKFLGLETNTLYNYIPDEEYRPVCNPDGSLSNKNHLLFDDISKVYRYSAECVSLSYVKNDDGTNIHTHSSNIRHSNVNNTYILRDHAIVDDILVDYIFNEEYDMHNNYDEINRIREARTKPIEKSNPFTINMRMMNGRMYPPDIWEIAGDNLARFGVIDPAAAVNVDGEVNL